MADERDFRIRMDITLPPQAQNYADQIRDALTPFLQYGVVIHPDEENEERGFVAVERCGHRIGESCEKIARWEVGKGKVYPEE